MNTTTTATIAPLLPTVYDTEEDQIRRAAGGDAEAFRLLVERYRGLMFRVIVEIVQDVELAEDVAQESWIAASRYLSSLEEPRAFRRWITTIAKHTAFRARRGRVRDLRVVFPGVDLELVATDGGSDAGTDVADEVAGRMGDSDARDWLDRLPECYRSTLSLRYLQDLSYQEIADELGIKLGTVKFRISKGVSMLKEYALAA